MVNFQEVEQGIFKEIDKAIKESNSKGEVMDLMQEKEVLQDEINEQREQKINIIVEQLNVLEAERLRQEGYTNSCFFNADGSLTDSHKITVKEKQKYFYIDFGHSGGFMVEKATGNIFNIKGYGTPNFAKFRGNIKDIDIKILHSKRWDYR